MEQKQEKKTDYPIRELFLREFVSRMISQGYTKEVVITKVLDSLKKMQDWKEPTQRQKFIPVQVTNQLKQITQQNLQSQQQIPQQEKVQQNTQQGQQQSYFPFQSKPQKPLYILKPLTGQSQQPAKQTQRPATNPPPRQMPPPRSMAPQKQNYQPSIATKEELMLPKILPILNDPTVFSIECTGQGKPLLLNKYGNIQVSNLSLSEAEVNQILQEISNRTRIPLITGTFKAAFDNFICTAVISDFIATRFIIQKKPMMQSPMSNQRLQPIIR
jgi:hypothetical protein